MKDRFAKLKYKIFGLKEPVLKKYPDLLRYKAIAQAKDLPGIDEVLRYIIFLYDENTDLSTDYPVLNERRTEAVALAGLNGDQFKEIIALEEPYKAIILTFLCEIYFNRDFREWQTAQQELDEFTRMRWNKEEASKLNTKQRSDLSDFCDKLNLKIDALEEKMWGDHDDVKKEIIQDRWSSPEKFAAPTLKLLNV